MKVSKRGKEAFAYFSRCPDTARLEPIEEDLENGLSAEQCFYARETYGDTSKPCREVDLLARALNGKARHGITVKMCAEDLVDCLLSTDEVRREFPEWVASEIFLSGG